MSSANLFAPPAAAVHDVMPVSADHQPIQLWSARGRIGRLRYLFYSVGMSFVVMVVNILLSLIGTVVVKVAGLPTWLVFVLPCVMWIVYTVFTVLLLIQRSHDMGWSGWTLLAAFIPFAGLIWLFKAGTPGANDFGAPPPPNSTGVKIFAWLFIGFIAISMIGIIAAVSLPAYQQYVKHARAVQAK